MINLDTMSSMSLTTSSTSPCVRSYSVVMRAGQLLVTAVVPSNAVGLVATVIEAAVANVAPQVV